jgi:hypothetical protein
MSKCCVSPVQSESRSKAADAATDNDDAMRLPPSFLFLLPTLTPLCG